MLTRWQARQRTCSIETDRDGDNSERRNMHNNNDNPVGAAAELPDAIAERVRIERERLERQRGEWDALRLRMVAELTECREAHERQEREIRRL